MPLVKPVFVVSSFSGSMSELHSISFISPHYNIIECLFLTAIQSPNSANKF